jgi:DNA-binding transcriptional ArsR family regulator
MAQINDSMPQDIQKINELKIEFRESARVLSAIGDETRQLILVVLLQAGCDGLRVGEITAQTHLSRPAVSHHLKILKEAGVVKLYKEATMNYYYLDPTGSLMKLKNLLINIEEMVIAQQKHAAAC